MDTDATAGLILRDPATVTISYQGAVNCRIQFNPDQADAVDKAMPVVNRIIDAFMARLGLPREPRE